MSVNHGKRGQPASHPPRPLEAGPRLAWDHSLLIPSVRCSPARTFSHSSQATELTPSRAQTRRSPKESSGSGSCCWSTAPAHPRVHERTHCCQNHLLLPGLLSPHSLPQPKPNHLQGGKGAREEEEPRVLGSTSQNH